MTIRSVDPMESTGAILNLIAKKQKVIGENLANMDTPGYQRQDLNFSQYLAENGSSLEARVTEKFGPSPVFDQTSDELINPADELMELQKNSLLYTMATRRMSNIITEMKTAINVGK